VQRGDRIGVVGANGTGKTTLLKLLTGEIAPDEGTIRRAQTLEGIMIDQQRKLLDPDKRVRDILADGGDWIEVRGVKKHVQGYLKEFLFDPGLVDARIGTLSGGERSRLLLAREFARRSNLLVLDEPTNDLDLETLDLLQEVIADYDGTVLIVSHDRDFLDRTVTITLGLDGTGQVDIVAGGYEDWERRRRQATAPSRSPAKAGAQSAAESGPGHRRGTGSSPTRTSATTTCYRAASRRSRRRSRATKPLCPIPTFTRAIRSASPSSARPSNAPAPSAMPPRSAGSRLPSRSRR
jgi:ATP-binding cassette subfamily F protein uup